MPLSILFYQLHLIKGPQPQVYEAHSAGRSELGSAAQRRGKSQQPSSSRTANSEQSTLGGPRAEGKGGCWVLERIFPALPWFH